MTKKKDNALNVFVLLDRSGSMSGPRWESAIGGINTYIHQLRKENVKANITVAAFDSFNDNGNIFNNASFGQRSNSGLAFEVLRDNLDLEVYKDIDSKETCPRGGTPLYDATGVLLNLADKANGEKTVILIMTDGDENQSKTYNLTSIKDRIATCTNRGWEVVFLGAEFNADNMTQSLGLSMEKTMSTTTRGFAPAMTAYATSSASYALTNAPINTTEMKKNIPGL